jgi:hypothetical protein
MADPRSTLVTFPLNLGMDNVSLDESVQPTGARPRVILSQNTRLSSVPGCVAKAPESVEVATGLSGAIGGIIPIGCCDSTLVPSCVPSETKRVAAGVAAAPTSIAGGGAPQSAYYPAQVTSAGVLRGTDGARWNASCAYDSGQGWTYFVTLRAQGSALFANAGVYLNVVDDNGAEIVSGDLLVQFTTDILSDENFAAITVHGSDVVLWYAEAGAASLTARTVSVSSSTYAVTLGTPTTIYTPVSVTTGPKRIQVAYDPQDSSNAYVAIQHSSVAANTAVLRVAIPGLTIAASTFVASGTHEWVGLAYKSGVGVLLATVAAASACNLYELSATTLVTSWSALAILDTGIPSLGFQTHNGVVYRVIALSRFEATQTGTLLAWYTPLGVAYATSRIKHGTLIGPVVTLRNSGDTFDALFPTQVCYEPITPQNSYDPNSNSFVPDPSVDVFRSVSTLDPNTGSVVLGVYCVARLGTDLVIRYPGGLNLGSTLFIGSSCSCIDKGSSALITYLQENTIDGNIADGYSVRHAEVSFGALQPRVATSQDGVAIVAGALPAVWDGALLTEFSPMRQPKITGVATGGGSGVPLPAGVYQFAIVVSWKDAAGTIHRSAPSNVIALSDGANPVDPIITVFLHNSYRDLLAQPGFQVVVYASEVDGLTPYATRKWQVVTGITYTTTTASVIDPLPGSAGAFTPAIYTDGSETQELAAFCPNACLDVDVIADRVWMLDAERRWLWPYSKPKTVGVFFEMSPDLYVITPSSAGRGVALSQWNGNPLFLTERGIWTVAGEGPDALLNPPFFSSAVQVSDVACTQRSSVVRSPNGVLFVNNNRFVRFNGQMNTYGEIDALLYGLVVGTAVFRKQQEVVFFLADGYAYVYNWTADAWTQWDTTVTGLSQITGCAQLANGLAMITDGSSIRTINPDLASTVAQMQISTGWLALGGPQDENVLHDLMIHARREGSHGLSVITSRDYRSSPTQSRTWSAADVLSCVGDSRYDVYPQLAEPSMRSLKLTVRETDAAGEAFQPINVTIDMIKNPGKRTRALCGAARK